jgi:hypothetical protein
LHLAATVTDCFALARAHLNRARTLALDVKMHAWLALRNGAMLVRPGEFAGIASLEEALHGVERLSLECEMGVTHLHLAEANFRNLQEDNALAHLV